MKKSILIAAALCIVLGAAAQPGGRPGQNGGPGAPGERPQQPKQLTVKEEAQMKVDQMAAELPLTKRQVRKLFRYYKKDITYRRKHFGMEQRGPRPDFGSGEGRPDFGSGEGRPDFGSGKGRPDFGSGRPPQGMGGPQGGGRPPQMQAQADPEKLYKYNEKQEKKLQKILGESLYARWRSAHPQETQMPADNIPIR